MTEIKEDLDAACCLMDSETPQFTDFPSIIKKEVFDDTTVKHEEQMNMDRVILKPMCESTAIEHPVIGGIKDEKDAYFLSEELTVHEFSLDSVKVEPETISSFDEMHPIVLKQKQDKSPCLSPEMQHELFLDGPSNIYGRGIECTTHSESKKRPKIVGGLEIRKLVQNSGFDGQLFICPHCCHSFQSEVLLNQHTQIHTAVELAPTGPEEAVPDCQVQTAEHKYFVRDLVIKTEESVSNKDRELEILQKKYERLVAKNEILKEELSRQCEEIKSYENKLKHLENQLVSAKSRKRKSNVLLK